MAKSETKASYKKYLVFGRRNPSEAEPQPKIVVSQVYARNELFAKSRFWSLNK